MKAWGLVAAIVALPVGCGGSEPEAVIVNERAGLLHGVRFGDSERQVRARLGEPVDDEPGFFPGGAEYTGPPAIPAPGGAGRPTQLHYGDAAYLVSPTAGVYSMATLEAGARTRAAVGVGDDLDLVRERYLRVECGESASGEAPMYRWCRAVTDGARVFFGGDPIESITLTAAPTPVPTAARIVCDAHATTVATPRVRPQRDGIHLRFENRAGRPLGYSVDTERGGGRGGDLPAAGAEVVVSLPPAPLEIACLDPRSDADPSEARRAALEAVDPEGLWTPAVLTATCENAVSSQADYAPGARGEAGRPVDVVRRLLERRGVLRSGDVVEPAGYPDQPEHVVRLARGGKTVTVVELRRDGSGGWLVETVTACAGIGLG